MKKEKYASILDSFKMIFTKRNLPEEAAIEHINNQRRNKMIKTTNKKARTFEVFDRQISMKMIYQSFITKEEGFFEPSNFDFNPSLPITLLIKWGGIDPFVVQVWQKLLKTGDHRMIEEISQGKILNREIIEICKKRPWWKYIKGATAYCDPCYQDSIKEWRDAGVNAIGIKKEEKMTDFRNQAARIDDDIKQLKRIGNRLEAEEKKDKSDNTTIIELSGLSIRLKNRIAQELGQMKAFKKGGLLGDSVDQFDKSYQAFADYWEACGIDKQEKQDKIDLEFITMINNLSKRLKDRIAEKVGHEKKEDK